MLFAALEVPLLLNCLLAVVPTFFDVCSFFPIHFLPFFARFFPPRAPPNAAPATLLTALLDFLLLSNLLALRATRFDVTGFAMLAAPFQFGRSRAEFKDTAEDVLSGLGHFKNLVRFKALLDKVVGQAHAARLRGLRGTQDGLAG